MFLFLISGLAAYWLVIDPYRNKIYPPQLREETEIAPESCTVTPDEKPPLGVPDSFLKE